MLDHCGCHDVEDAAGVDIFDIGQLVVAVAVGVGSLDLPVYLNTISAFEVYSVVAMNENCGSDRGVRLLLLGHLFDIQSLFIGNIELGTNLGDHVLDRYLLGRRSCPFVPFARPDLYGAATTDLTLELDGRLDHLGLPDLFHQI